MAASPALSLPGAAVPAPRAETPAVVRFDRLLLPYAVVPLCLLLFLLDRGALHGALQRRLPSAPEKLLFFTLVFNFPHVVASHLILLDPEYARAYGRRIVGALAVLAALTYALVHQGLELFFLFTVVVTSYHVIAQQLGLTGAQLRTKDWSFPAWKLLSLVAGVGPLVLPPLVALPPFSPGAWLVSGAASLALLGSTALALRLSRRSATAGGRRYLWANQAMLWLMALFLLQGYPLFTALMARVVHDTTAFYVYTVHDTNRARGGSPNWLFAALGRLHLSPWVAGPASAVVLAFTAEHLLPSAVGQYVVYTLSALHYYLEAIVWKSGSLHRRAAAFR